jgi:hypothetical protein
MLPQTRISFHKDFQESHPIPSNQPFRKSRRCIHSHPAISNKLLNRIMGLQYMFLNICGHTGIGPIIHANSHHASSPTAQPNAATGIPLALPFPCPFCSPGSLYLNTPTSTGILVILSTTSENAYPSFPNIWHVVRNCRFEDITWSDWELAFEYAGAGEYRHMAWIVRPEGEVRVIGCVEEREGDGTAQRGTIRRVKCRWKERIREGESVETRFEGMMQRLNADLLRDGG